MTGIEIPCFSLNQLKLLSMALGLMLSMLARSDVLLADILLIDYFKHMSMCITMGYGETFYRPKKVTDKVDTSKSINVVAAVLCPWTSEL